MVRLGGLEVGLLGLVDRILYLTRSYHFNM